MSAALTKIFKLIEEVKFETIAMRKEQQEQKAKIETLLTLHDKTNTINRFSRLLPMSSMESFDEINESLINSEENFQSLVRILKNNKINLILKCI